MLDGMVSGGKLHLIIDDKGEILNFMFTPGNVDDREPLKQGRLLGNIKRKLCTDKEYTGQALFETLFLNGVQLITKVKNKMKNSQMSITNKILLRKCALIEIVNDELPCYMPVINNNQHYVTNHLFQSVSLCGSE